MKKFVIMLATLMLLMCGCDINENLPVYETGEKNERGNYAGYGSAAKFDEYKLNYTDPDGFSYEVTCRISPWILQSDSENLNPTWNSISKRHELPTINTWGFQKSGGVYRFSEFYINTFESKIDDMYYAVGTLSIKNTTKGFSFSKDRIGYPNIQIGSGLSSRTDKQMITRIYFGNEETTSSIAVQAKAKMTSDNWGPVPFVIAYAEQYTPNYPNGVNYQKAEGFQIVLCHAESSNKDLVPMTISHLK